MIRLVAFLLAVFAIASGLVWLADRPGNLHIVWQGYDIETSVFQAVVMLTAVFALSLFAWSLAHQIWMSPATVGKHLTRRRQKRGLEALSGGIIAIGAGDKALATRYALQARRALPNEPLTHLLRAQAAQLSGDRTTSRRIFEAMLSSPDTEQLGLRGLYLEAQREKESEAARQYAERALRLNPKLAWPADALFELQCRAKDWAGALETVSIAKRNGLIDKQTGDRRRAVLLTAKAQALEDSDQEKALTLAIEAHGLAPDLIPAAAIAGRILAAKGNTPRVAKIIQKTWSRAPHPELAATYAYARIGDSPRDRLDRVKQLATIYPNSIESPIAIASAAIEARDWAEARSALEPLLQERLTQRVATLMARVEDGEFGDKGGVREWLARAVNAQRDPAWTADGVVAEEWAPVSPVTGALDAFEWRVPVEAAQPAAGRTIESKVDELISLGAPIPTIDARAEPEPVQAGEPTASVKDETLQMPAVPASQAAPNVKLNGSAPQAPAAAPEAPVINTHADAQQQASAPLASVPDAIFVATSATHEDEPHKASTYRDRARRKPSRASEHKPSEAAADRVSDPEAEPVTASAPSVPVAVKLTKPSAPEPVAPARLPDDPGLADDEPNDKLVVLRRSAGAVN